MSIRRIVLERLKKTALVWMAVYPSVLVVLTLLDDALNDWPLPLRVLWATAIIVPIVANIAEPAVRALASATERLWRRSIRAA